MKTTNTAETETVKTCYAEECDGAITVVDPDGGRWWPSDEAAADIAASASPLDRALAIADHEPMRGEWRS